VLEALLFASDDLLTAARLKTVLPGGPDARTIRNMVERINRRLQKEQHPFEIVEIGGGYQFKTVAYYHPWVRQIFQEKASRRLSIQALECLSIIAYRQPLSKAEIEAIRGVISDGAMKTLLERRLITVTGRSEKVGRPLLYGTTQEFLTYFGLNKIGDLPKIEEFEAMVRRKIEDMPAEELKSAQEQAKADAAEEEALAESVCHSDSEMVEVRRPSDSGGGSNSDNN
jgi:segregation and condensation protein B